MTIVNMRTNRIHDIKAFREQLTSISEQFQEVMRTLPDSPAGGFAFLNETQRNNVRIVKELIVDRIDDCKVYPLVGPARLHHCHYKCTVYYDKILRSYWPIPFTHNDQSQEVVYIDKDHLIRCTGPATY